MVAIAAASRRLNEVYTKALDALNHSGRNSAPYNPEIPKRLIAAERTWIAFRDAECEYKSTIALTRVGVDLGILDAVAGLSP